MEGKTKYIYNAEVEVVDNNGITLQFDEVLYMEFGKYFKILQDNEEVFSGFTQQVKNIKYSNKEDIIYI